MRIILTILLFLTLTATAQARTVEQDLADAQAYWGSSVCAGQWVVPPDPTLPSRGHAGEATGIGFEWMGDSWRWFIARCEFTMDPQIQGCERLRIVRHEIGHFVWGPEHGPELAAADRAPCTIRTATRRRQRASRTVSGRVRR